MSPPAEPSRPPRSLPSPPGARPASPPPHALSAATKRSASPDASSPSTPNWRPTHTALATAVTDQAPELLEVRGVGPVVAATVLQAWSHPGRVHSRSEEH